MPYIESIMSSFNPTLVQFKHRSLKISVTPLNTFNPTLVQFKLAGEYSPYEIGIPTFNPTLVQFKLSVYVYVYLCALTFNPTLVQFKPPRTGTRASLA